MYSQPVHSSMSCIHCLLGLSWCRIPSMILSRTVSANCPALPRVMWPKYCSFSFATLPINSISRPNSVNIESFVWCSCHEMLSIFLQHHISKASILFLSDFFKVHPWHTLQTCQCCWHRYENLNKGLCDQNKFAWVSWQGFVLLPGRSTNLPVQQDSY